MNLRNGLPDDKAIRLKLYDKNTQALAHQYKSQYELVKEYFTFLSLCHECMIETKPEGSTYAGESPDEIALVKAASMVDFKYSGRTSSYKEVIIFGEKHKIEELLFFPFNSDRKRASVIVRHQGKIKIMMKGADNKIIERLSREHPQPYLGGIEKKLEIFSRKGLRTLCMAERIISEGEWDKIWDRYLCINDAPDPVVAFEELAQSIEKEMTLIGCSAVEDKLQDEVPETIRDFLKAEIKVWMLTGDKLATAENIGYSCKLIQEDFHKLYIRADSNLQEKYQECVAKIKELDKQKIKRTLLIEGSAVSRLLIEDKPGENFRFKLKNDMINNVMTKCHSVICCRVSPKEKALVVGLVRENLGKITLAIGDGANDVNMI
jgi:magnesium-transporting ATPase (P-type)